MAIQENIDAIDPTKPINPPLVKTDPKPTSKSVRDNFLAIKNGMQGLLDTLGTISSPPLSSFVLTGLSLSTATAIVATDNLLVALSKLQAQLSLRATIDSPALTGTPTAPTATTGTSTTQLATTEFAALADANVLAAAKTYTDTATTGLLQDCGTYDASGNLWPSSGGSGTGGTILKGDVWYLSVGGTLGGVYYESHTSIRALTDTPGQTVTNWATLEGAFGYVPENISNKSTSTGDIASTTKYPVWAIIVSWATATWQPLSAKLTAIAALATTNGSAIVGNGTTFALQALGTAAAKNVGTASTDVAAGNCGLPTGGTANQVLAKVDGTDYNTSWVTVSGGSSGYKSAFISIPFQYLTSTQLILGTPIIKYSDITGLSINGSGHITLPAGIYKITYRGCLVGAGRITGGLDLVNPVTPYNVLSLAVSGVSDISNNFTNFFNSATASSSASVMVEYFYYLSLSSGVSFGVWTSGVSNLRYVIGTGFGASSALYGAFEIVKMS
ncbi:MAG: hypothetical protein PHU14_00020 [Methylovulum sp.]|nr:hypothetical protein [Methylovulum sp.]